jgi:hypothetical protein
MAGFRCDEGPILGGGVRNRRGRGKARQIFSGAGLYAWYDRFGEAGQRLGASNLRPGQYVVPGALDLVSIDRERDRGTYHETNLWMRHC